MVEIIEQEYCDKCGKYMKYDAKGKCVKCKTLIYKSGSIKNTAIYDLAKDMGMDKSETNIGGYDIRYDDDY